VSTDSASARSASPHPDNASAHGDPTAAAGSGTMTIRLYREETDRAAMSEICMVTGAAGGDARPLYRDQELLPDIFAHPYTVFDPGLAFVADDGGRAVGYIVGTADTARFVKQFREQWLPRVAASHAPPPAPGRPPAGRDEAMSGLLHEPERMIVPELADYPAHLHIDLLPGYQGRGGGRALMTAFLAAARRAGADRVHLGMLRSNVQAGAFYARMGFTELRTADQPDDLVYLVRETG
jgi:GNAT superfamily N-acetyltransferase